jgi:hypothetical protein
VEKEDENHQQCFIAFNIVFNSRPNASPIEQNNSLPAVFTLGSFLKDGCF